MTKQFTLYIFLLINLIGNSSYAQSISPQTVTLKGSIVDSELKDAMMQVSVKLLSEKDSSLVKATVSNEKGYYTLQGLKPGNYLLQYSFLGYKTITNHIKVPANDPTKDLGRITMYPADIMLQEAVVTGKVAEVVVKEDTVEYNAASYKTEANAMVEDLLKKIPGIEVDSDGKIKAHGKEVKKVLVDGKEFFGNDSKMATKNLPVDIIDKLQVVDRKSDESRITGVDDGEDETVINLTVKKGMKKGWFGQATIGGGTKERYEGNGNINRFVNEQQFSIVGSANNTNNMGFSDMGSGMYSGNSRRGTASGGNGINTTQMIGANFNVGKDEKIRVGGNISYSHSDLNRRQTKDRQNFFKDSVSYNKSENTNLTKSQNIGANIRLQWKIDSLTTVDFRPNFKINLSDVNENSHSLTQAGNASKDSINRGDNLSESNGNGYDLSGRLIVSRLFKKKPGRQISLSFEYSARKSIEDGTDWSDNYFYLNDSTSIINQLNKDKTWGGSYRVRASYIEPIGKYNFLTFAYLYNYNYNNADKLAYDIEDLNERIDYILNGDYSNQFRNTFQTQEISASFRTVRPKYMYNIGVNVNPSRSKSENLIDNERSVPTRSVVNFAPNLYFTYKFDKRTSLRLDYRGRTQQPSISELQPVKNISNPLNIRVGNPDLNPSFRNDFSIRFNDYKTESQRSIMAFIRGGFTTNSIVNQSSFNPLTGVQTTKPVNINGVWSTSGNLMFSTPFKNKRFQINTFTNVGYNNSVGFNKTSAKASAEKNNSGTFNVRENLGFDYRSDLFDAGIRGNYNYSVTRNSISTNNNREIMNFGGTFNTTIYFPLNFALSSDVTYNGNQGYSAGYDENQWLWNAQLSAQFLKKKQATVMFKIYDILQQRSNITRTITGNYIQDVRSNTLTSYCMLYFSYKFNTMGGRRPQAPRDADGNRGGDRERHEYRTRNLDGGGSQRIPGSHSGGGGF